MRAFEIPIVVRPADIDDNDHVNNVIYLHWVYEVALAHWMARSTPEIRAEFAWVATRHELDYKREARLGDAIVARTWIGDVDSRRFERHTEIVRTTDQAVLARGRTLWCLINRATGKITRIAPTILACFPPAEGAPDEPLARLADGPGSR